MNSKIVNLSSKFIFIDTVGEELTNSKSQLISEIKAELELENTSFNKRGFNLSTNCVNLRTPEFLESSKSVLPLIWEKVDLMLSQTKTAYQIEQSLMIDQWFYHFNQNNHLGVTNHLESDFTVLLALDVIKPIDDAIMFRNIEGHRLFNQTITVTLEKNSILIFPSHLHYEINSEDIPFTLFGANIETVG